MGRHKNRSDALLEHDEMSAREALAYLRRNSNEAVKSINSRVEVVLVDDDHVAVEQRGQPDTVVHVDDFTQAHGFAIFRPLANNEY